MAILRFSPTMGKSPKIAKIFPYRMVFTFGGAMALGLGSAFFWESFVKDALKVPSLPTMLYFALSLAVLVLDLYRGQKPYKIDSQFWPFGRNWESYRIGAKHNPQKQLIPNKVEDLKVDGKKLPAIENEFPNLITYIEYRLKGAVVGGYLLKDKDRYKIVFTWEVTPFNSSLTASEAQGIASRLRNGLKAVGTDETLTFRFGAWRVTPPRPEPTGNKLKDILAYWEWDRTRTQVALGRRTEKTLYCSASYSIGGTGEKANDVIDKLKDTVRNIIDGYRSPKQPEGLGKILAAAYTQGYKSRERMLKGQLGLTVRVLNCDETWALDYQRLNSGAIPRIPYKLVIDATGTHIERNNDLHLISALCSRGAPKMRNKRHVRLTGKNQYVRGAVWDDKPFVSYDPNNPDDAISQLFFGSSLINDCQSPEFITQSSEIWDSEIVVQFTGQDQEQIRKEAFKLEEEANFKSKIAKSTDDVSSKTVRMQNKTFESHEQLLDGAFGISVAWMGFVYRDTAEDADNAIYALCDSPDLKGYVHPESEYFPKLWKDSLPFAFWPMLSSPMIWNRQMKDLTGPCSSFIPVIADSSPAKRGVEFHSEYGNSPFHIPHIEDEISRKITLGESGSGKSLRACSDLVESYQSGIRSFVIDASQVGTGTFSPICEAIGGAMFDSRKESFNLLQGTDRRKLHDAERREFALNLLRDQWSSTLTSIAMGGRVDPNLKADYADITSMLLWAWLEDPELRRRYDLAFDRGFGTDAWAQMPTLRDYIELIHKDRLPTHAQTAENEAILTQYRSRLAAFLHTGAGDRISRVSSFDADAPIVVCALGNINNMSQADVLPYIASTMSLVTSSALRYPKTNIKGDEASKLSEYDCFSIPMGGLYSGGRKDGLAVEILGQDLLSIKKGAGSSKILENNKVWQIGRVASLAADFLSTPTDQQGNGGLGIPRELLALVDEKSPRPAEHEFYSRWLIQSQGKRIIGRLPISFFQMAISVNDPKEKEEREKYLKRYPDDRLRGYVEYGKLLKSQSIDSTVKSKR